MVKLNFIGTSKEKTIYQKLHNSYIQLNILKESIAIDSFLFYNKKYTGEKKCLRYIQRIIAHIVKKLNN